MTLPPPPSYPPVLRSTSLVGSEDSTKSKLASLRRALAEQAEDTFSQNLGYRINYFFNTGPLVHCNITVRVTRRGPRPASTPPSPLLTRGSDVGPAPCRSHRGLPPLTRLDTRGRGACDVEHRLDYELVSPRQRRF